MVSHGRIFLTGATGYIGGRLLPRLLDAGYRVRCLVREASRLEAELAARCEVVTAPLDDHQGLVQAMAGCSQAYYLIHAMRDRGANFVARDREQAAAFATACLAAGVERIIYLGGLGDQQQSLSPHLRSRQEVGQTLAASGVPTVEFRAAVIVGSGSASFEMLRHLAERLPVMITPHWVRTRCQPIAIRDMLGFLLRVLDQPERQGVFEVGGADVLSYAEMMLIYARVRALRRFLIPVPVLTPALSSWWVHLVTPIPRAIARPLIDGLRCEVVAPDARRSAEIFGLQPLSYEQAVRLALRRLAAGDPETVWHRSFSSLSDRTPGDRLFVNHEGLLVEKHERLLTVDPAKAFRACCRVGGSYGWPGSTPLWRLRACCDRLIGGVGFRRGRPGREELRPGDAVDFWRVASVDRRRDGGGSLLLHAEMRLPGEGWLRLAAEPVTAEDGQSATCRINATAFFEPRGVIGLVYWLITMPLHRWVFPALTRGLARRALLARGGSARS